MPKTGLFGKGKKGWKLMTTDCMYAGCKGKACYWHVEIGDYYCYKHARETAKDWGGWHGWACDKRLGKRRKRSEL